MPTDNRQTAHDYDSQSTDLSNDTLTNSTKLLRIHTHMNGSYTGATNCPKAY